MVNQHCCWGTCTNDSRKRKNLEKHPHMMNVFFILFPKKKYNLEVCKRWIRLCGREDLNLEKITRNTHICSMHFIGGNGRTDDHPDPFSACRQTE